MSYGTPLLMNRSIPFLRFHKPASNPIKYKSHKDSAHQGKFDKTCQACKELRYRRK